MLHISTPTRYRAAPFLKPRTTVTTANPPKPRSRGPTPPALPREHEPDLHQHRHREATTSSKRSKSQIRSIGLHRHRETAARLDLARPSTGASPRSPHTEAAGSPLHARTPSCQGHLGVAATMADPTPPPPPLLALHLQPPTSSAPRQDPANALVVSPLCLQTSTKQSAPPHQAHCNHQHHHGAQQ